MILTSHLYILYLNLSIIVLFYNYISIDHRFSDSSLIYNIKKFGTISDSLRPLSMKGRKISIIHFTE